MAGNVVFFRDRFDPLTRSQLDFARAAILRLDADVYFSPTYTGEAPTSSRAGFLSDMIKKENIAEFHLDFFEAKGKGKYGLFETLRHIALLRPGAKIYVPLSAGGMKELGEERLHKLMGLATILYVAVPGETPDDHLLSLCSPHRFPFGKVGDYHQSEVRNLHTLDIPSYVRERIENERLYFVAKLQKYMSERRLLHSISVADLSYYIALRSKVEHPEKAYIAGMVHDIAKNVKDETARRLLAKFKPEYASFPVWTYHQFLAPMLVKEEFGLEDPQVNEAISCHATGKAHMIPLAKILYAADKIEPTRGFDSTDLIQACLKNYYVGFLTTLEANREYLFGKGYSIDNPLTQECFDLYLGER